MVSSTVLDLAVVGADGIGATGVVDEVTTEEERVGDGPRVEDGLGEEVAHAGEYLGRAARGDADRKCSGAGETGSGTDGAGLARPRGIGHCERDGRGGTAG